MKKLTAIAIATVIAPTAALASGPVMYGKIHMGLNYFDNDSKSVAQGGVGEYSSMSLSSNSSRLGVKGSEDLGNGLKVGYKMEWQVGVDGSKDWSQRNRGISLSGGFGKVLLGRWDTPMKKLNGKVEMFGDTVGDMDSVTKGKSSIDGRKNNMIMYSTPKMSGFSATLGYVLDTNASGDDTDNEHLLSANAMYKNGPLLVGAGFSKIYAADTSSKEDETDWRIIASYKMGKAKVAASFTDINNGKGSDGNDFEVYTLGGKVGFGNNAVKMQVVHKTEGLVDDEATVWTLGLDHKMSKRTKAYIAYSMVNNGDNASVVPYAKSGNGMNDADADSAARGFTIGLVHKF